MTHILVRQPVTLTIPGPVLCAGNGPSTWGLDIGFYRNWEGKLALPASHLRGKLKESMEVTAPGGVSYWFGKPSGEEASDFEPLRGMLKLNDFVCIEPQSRDVTGTRTRIRISPERGTVEQGAMVCAEFPFSSGKTTRWQGELEFFADETQVESKLNSLKQAFCFVTTIGGEKTVGFGRLAKVEFGEKQCVRPAAPKPSIPSKVYGIKVSLDFLEPFVIGGIQKTDNLIISESVIPGTVLKGACASGLNRLCGNSNPAVPITQDNTSVFKEFPMLARYFSGLTFRHAFPSHSQDHRPETIPFSGVSYGGKYKDIALVSDESKLWAQDRYPVCFQIDWKGAPSALPARYKKPEIEFHSVTRTAIDPDLLSAKENQLYSFLMVKPENKQGKIHWNSEVRFPEGMDEQTATLLKEEMERALPLAMRYVGKRQSSVELTVSPISELSSPVGLSANEFALVLQTPALTINPQDWVSHAAVTGKFDDSEKLHDLYAGFWSVVLDENVELPRFFATQELQGGYIGMRFLKDVYRPFYLTSAGSTFVFKQNGNPDLRNKLKRILTYGLELPEWVYHEYGAADIWKKCPFTRENGFGEIKLIQGE